jgi:hypothetical protein
MARSFKSKTTNNTNKKFQNQKQLTKNMIVYM